jgi:hypothetical protein
MKIKLASILALVGCFVFSASQNGFAAAGQFDNFRSSSVFSNARFVTRNTGFTKTFDAFAGSTFDFANGFQSTFDRTTASNGPAVK